LQRGKITLIGQEIIDLRFIPWCLGGTTGVFCKQRPRRDAQVITKYH
jgi:hypothetical protein